MDFRVAFAKMDPAALINGEELAILLCTTYRNILVMKTRGQLPPTAFPARKINRWNVAVVRNWLLPNADTQEASDDVVGGRGQRCNVSELRRRPTGRPRAQVERL